MDRRELITTGLCLIAAPAIVRYSSLMPVKVIDELMPVKVIDDWETKWRVNVMAKSKRLRAEYQFWCWKDDMIKQIQKSNAVTHDMHRRMNDLAREITENSHNDKITITDPEDIKLLEKMGIV